MKTKSASEAFILKTAVEWFQNPFALSQSMGNGFRFRTIWVKFINPFMLRQARHERIYSVPTVFFSGRGRMLPKSIEDSVSLLALLFLLAVPGDVFAQPPHTNPGYTKPLETVGYRIEKFSESTGIHLGNFDLHQILILEKLNRADRKHLSRLRQVVVPKQWDLSELAYSPLPLIYSWASDYAKAIVVHQPLQAFGAYEYGRLVRWGPVSTGQFRHKTPSGFFHLNWKSRGRHSTVNPRWYMPWYFNFENARGLSFHAYVLPGYPASHACVRMLDTDAQWLYHWGEQWELDALRQTLLRNGTPVLILGHYDFNSPPPWRSLENLSRPVNLPAEPLTNLGG